VRNTNALFLLADRSAMVYIPNAFIPEYRAARKLPIASSGGWWLNRWPFLGWLETAVKVMAFIVASHVPLRNSGDFDISARSQSPSFYIETFLMFGGASLITLAVLDRIFYREIISMMFVLPNIWAHWTVAAAMYRFGRGGISTRYFRQFCWLMLTGDVVKLMFFTVHDFSMLSVARFVRVSLIPVYLTVSSTNLTLRMPETVPDLGFFVNTLRAY
jgi:hypothetical protein